MEELIAPLVACVAQLLSPAGRLLLCYQSRSLRADQALFGSLAGAGLCWYLPSTLLSWATFMFGSSLSFFGCRLPVPDEELHRDFRNAGKIALFSVRLKA